MGRFCEICEGYIGNSVTFLTGSKTLDEQVVRMRQNFTFLENIEWAEGEGDTDKTVDIELMISPHNSIFRIGDPDVDIRYTSTYPQISRIQINHLAGDSTTVDGVLRADNIEPATAGGKISIPKADIGEFSIGGQPIVPQAGTTPMTMGFKTETVVLYKDKVIGKAGKSTDTNPLPLTDEDNNPVTIECPKITLDYNFCGNVYFFSVRTFIMGENHLLEHMLLIVLHLLALGDLAFLC